MFTSISSFFLILPLLLLQHPISAASADLLYKAILQSDSRPSLPNPTYALRNLDSFLDGATLNGRWQAADHKNPQGFSRSEGFAVLSFLTEYTGGEDIDIHEKELTVYFYDGSYVDQGRIVFSLPYDRPTSPMDVENATLVYKNQLIHVQKKYFESKNCLMNISLYFIDPKTGHPFDCRQEPNEDNIALQAYVRSPDCGIEIITSATVPYDYLFDSQFIPYTVIMYLVTFLVAISYVNLYRKLHEEPHYILNTCLGTLYTLTTFDLFLFLEHVYSSTTMGTQITRPLFQGIGIAYAAVVVFFNLPFLMEIKFKISKLRWQEVKKAMDAFGNIGLFANFVAFILAFQAVVNQDRRLFYLLFIFFPLCQILQNAVLNRRFKWNWWYLGALVIPKVAFLIYSEAYPFNIFRNTPDVWRCTIFVSIICVQLLILMIQTRWPRFGFKGYVPYTIIKYPKDASKNCPICLEDFKAHRQTSSELDEALLQQEDHILMVVTPCHHEFHLACLQNWMEQKYECPYCRRTLPLSHQLEGVGAKKSRSAVNVSIL